MQNRKRDTLDSVGEGEGGMFQENSIETYIIVIYLIPTSSKIFMLYFPDFSVSLFTTTSFSGSDYILSDLEDKILINPTAIILYSTSDCYE